LELWQNDGVKYSLQVWLRGNHFINYIYNASLDFYMKNYASKWIMQRLTAVILIPLTFWFVYQCVILSNYEYDQIKSFFYSKINASLFFILIIAMLYHAKLGNETIVEDYVTSVNLKKITKLSISVLTYSSMILTTISLFYIVSS
jgi:succinate dehydrogenase / fumarate reductase membrane anchor subunit